MNVLLVEDEDTVAEVVMEAMKSWGQKVVWVTSKKEAAAKIAESYFDMVLLDIMLPDGYGYEIIPDIKRARPDVNIITMTGYNTLEMERTVRSYGITYYLSKPVNLDEFKTIVDHIEGKRVKEAETHG